MILATAYAAATGRSLGRVSRLANGDAPFFQRLSEKQGSFTMRKYDEAIDWFKANWPEDIERPEIRETIAELPHRKQR